MWTAESSIDMFSNVLQDLIPVSQTLMLVDQLWFTVGVSVHPEYVEFFTPTWEKVYGAALTHVETGTRGKVGRRLLFKISQTKADQKYTEVREHMWGVKIQIKLEKKSD